MFQGANEQLDHWMDHRVTREEGSTYMVKSKCGILICQRTH